MKLKLPSLSRLLKSQNCSLKNNDTKISKSLQQEEEPTTSFDGSSSSLYGNCDVIITKTSKITHALGNHQLYTSIYTLEDLRDFMESHVFAVLNFMWLLKALQRELTCVDEIWTPRQNPNLARFINEIVLDEESDENPSGGHSSHYELYLSAMEQVGANTKPVKKLVALLGQGISAQEAVEMCRDVIPRPAFQHTQANLDLLLLPRGAERTAGIAAAFTFGREDAIPTMFLGILDGLEKSYTSSHSQFDGFTYYLKRHIELDGDDHGPLALQMVEAVCGDSVDLWKVAEEAAVEALEERRALWDGVVEELTKKN
ncbi:MAG: hypothetical protein SGILL_007342 [Bacillariaceae sp.]